VALAAIVFATSPFSVGLTSFEAPAASAQGRSGDAGSGGGGRGSDSSGGRADESGGGQSSAGGGRGGDHGGGSRGGGPDSADRGGSGAAATGSAGRADAGRPVEPSRSFGHATAAERSRAGLERALGAAPDQSAVLRVIEALNSGDFSLVSDREEREALETGFE
jgi:hypothetical protein